MLNAGETISIKAYGYMIEKVVSMTEILKTNLGELNQETVFLSQPREQRFEDKEEDEAKRKGRHTGYGKRRGTREARFPSKVIWMRRMRVLRRLLRK